MEENRLSNSENSGDIVIYQTDDGLTKIDVRFTDETVWLTQAQLCALYQTSKSNISEHIKNMNLTKYQLFGNSEQLKLKGAEAFQGNNCTIILI